MRDPVHTVFITILEDGYSPGQFWSHRSDAVPGLASQNNVQLHTRHTLSAFGSVQDLSSKQIAPETFASAITPGQHT